MAAGLVAGCAGAKVPEVGSLTGEVREYLPVSRAMERFGNLSLSRTQAQFAESKDVLQLAYVRTVGVTEIGKDSWFEIGERAPVQMYRVENADKIKADIKWLALSFRPNGDLSLCTVTDKEGSIDPTLPTVGACGLYLAPR